MRGLLDANRAGAHRGNRRSNWYLACRAGVIAPPRRPIVRLARELDDPVGVTGDEREKLTHEIVGRGDAARERIMRVRFAQHGDAAAQAVVVRAESGTRVIRLPCRRRTLLAREIAVVEYGKVVALLHPLP